MISSSAERALTSPAKHSLTPTSSRAQVEVSSILATKQTQKEIQNRVCMEFRFLYKSCTLIFRFRHPSVNRKEPIDYVCLHRTPLSTYSRDRIVDVSRRDIDVVGCDPHTSVTDRVFDVTEKSWQWTKRDADMAKDAISNSRVFLWFLLHSFVFIKRHDQ